MNEINIHTLFFFSSLYLFIFSLILLSRKSCAADYLYESCQPKNCGNGPNIAFPFYIQGLQEPYCGHPGFGLECNENSYPTINLTENHYIVENISYTARSFHVYNTLFSGNSKQRCFPAMKNTTLTKMFYFVNVTRLFFLSNCVKPLPENLLQYLAVCETKERDDWELAIWEKDQNLQCCQRSVVVPMENATGEDDGNVEMLRKGFWLNWRASDCSVCAESGGRCGIYNYQFKCFCPDRPHVRSCKPAKRKAKQIILLTGVSFIVVAFSIILFTFAWRKYMLNGNRQNNDNIEVFLEKHGNLAPRRYKYSDLKKITSSLSDKLGEGGFGSVYKGNLREGHVVAVKILKESKGNGEEFINEVASISRTSHVNIVSLLGFCFEGSKRALIYEFMPNGSLEKFIYSNSSLAKCQLGWEKLFQIAVGIARGIEYLHQGCNMRILHFDIKPHNILLDKGFNPKISDFGLAKLCPNRSSIVSILGARGTIGYIAPELVCRNIGEVSHKSDVYSYGMMVLEIVGQRKNIDVGVERTSEIYFPHWIYRHLEQNVELDLNHVSNEDEQLTIRKMIIVGLWCIQTDPTIRPSMTKVLEMLEGNMESLQIPPKPYLSSPPRQEVNSSTSELELTSLL